MKEIIKRHSRLPIRITKFRVPRSIYAPLSLLGIYYIDSEYNASSFYRNFRTLWNGICITWDYKVNFKPTADISAIHQRTADRILYTCQKNGGLYVKFGQSIASMNHILPKEYSDTLRSLFMDAPSLPFDHVIRLFREEFGKHPDEVFVEFDREPVASASIAQVHRAKLSDGTPVAVKIQKDYIQRQMFWDMLAYRVVLRVFEFAFDLPLSWSAEYTERHLRQEVDFENEARNSEKAAFQFSQEPSLAKDIYVPKIHWAQTTKRILTTEWIDGVSLAKPDELSRAGFSLADVMYKAVSAFSFQIFQSRFVHADPHIGNIIIRKNPRSGKTQVCILDHGLYMEESEEFRSQYCLFWKYLFLMDMKQVENIASSWGINDIGIFAQATLQRPYNPKRAVHLGKQSISSEDIYRMQMVTKDRIKSFLSDTEKIPRELIFVGRTLNIIRSNNKHLGSPVNRVNIMASWAVRGLGNDSSVWIDGSKVSSNSTLSSYKRYFNAQFNYYFFQSQLFWISVTFYMTRFVQKFVYSVSGRRVWGFEDIMDNQMAGAMKQKFGIVVNVDNFSA